MKNKLLCIVTIILLSMLTSCNSSTNESDITDIKKNSSETINDVSLVSEYVKEMYLQYINENRWFFPSIAGLQTGDEITFTVVLVDNGTFEYGILDKQEDSLLLLKRDSFNNIHSSYLGQLSEHIDDVKYAPIFEEISQITFEIPEPHVPEYLQDVYDEKGQEVVEQIIQYLTEDKCKNIKELTPDINDDFDLILRLGQKREDENVYCAVFLVDDTRIYQNLAIYQKDIHEDYFVSLAMTSVDVTSTYYGTVVDPSVVEADKNVTLRYERLYENAHKIIHYNP